MKNYDNLLGTEVWVDGLAYRAKVCARIQGPIPTYKVQVGGRMLDRTYYPHELRRTDDPDMREVVKL